MIDSNERKIVNLTKMKQMFKSIKNNVSIDMIIDYIILINVIFSISIIIVILGEFINRTNLIDLYTWIIDFKIQFILNIVLFALLITLIGILFKNIGMGTLFSGGVYIILCIVNYYKNLLKGEYLNIYDFKLAGEGLNIVKDFNIKFESNIMISVMIFLLITVLALNLNFKYSLKKHISFFITFTIISIIAINFLYLSKSSLEYIGVTQDIFFDKQNYEDNGLALTLVSKISDAKINKPTNYSKQTVDEIASKYYSYEKNNSISPNVIMIMNEAFFDITEVDNLKLKKDPLENFHRYQAENIKAKVISSVFGAATAQTEYEALTGNSVDFIGVRNIAYTSYVREGMDSIVKIFSEEGYDTLAIHPYIKNFYKRDFVYKKMGFDKFISQDEISMENEVGRYISDKDTYRKLIEEFNNKKNGTPLFSHIVTMQNHAPYNDSQDADIILNTDISKESLNQAEGYISLLKESDEALKYLIDYFEKEKEPTMIVFFGDHAPLLGDFYIETGMATKEDMENMKNMKLYTVPLLIWSNYKTEDVSNVGDYGYIDSSYIGSKILRLIGLNNQPYYTILDQISRDIKALNPDYIIDSSNKYLSKENISKEQEELLEELWILQYDRIFGKNFLEEKFHE